jgi:hypothetical protein
MRARERDTQQSRVVPCPSSAVADVLAPDMRTVF